MKIGDKYWEESQNMVFEIVQVNYNTVLVQTSAGLILAIPTRKLEKMEKLDEAGYGISPFKVVFWGSMAVGWIWIIKQWIQV